MPSEDRDQQFERALARHLPSASPDSACPDAETLAAHQESTLSPPEMAHWKEHFATCERCLEILSLVAQTEEIGAEDWEQSSKGVPVEDDAMPLARAVFASAQPHDVSPTVSKAAAAPSSQVTSFRTRPRWNWLVPAGAIAAGVIVWIGVREHRTQRAEQSSEVRVAQNSAASSPTTANRSRDEASQEKKLVPELPAQSVPRAAPRTALTAPPIVAASKTTPPSSSTQELPRRKKDAIASDRTRNGESRIPPLAETYVERGRSAEISPADVSGVPTPTPPPVTRENRLSAKTENQNAKQAAGAQPSPAALSASSSEISAQVVVDKPGDSLDLVHLASGDPRYVIAPGETHAWRLGAGGRIEHSTDRGKTWKLQNSGVSADLTAGSATSDKVCWVVGKSGTLLLTSDGGKHWEALASPITGDIGGIHATDALHASIWDVPNRQSYETSDGGVTWSRTTNE
jgi:hypothetical protein